MHTDLRQRRHAPEEEREREKEEEEEEEEEDEEEGEGEDEVEDEEAEESPPGFTPCPPSPFVPPLLLTRTRLQSHTRFAHAGHCFWGPRSGPFGVVRAVLDVVPVDPESELKSDVDGPDETTATDRADPGLATCPAVCIVGIQSKART